jgi:hypothetical protein
VREECFLLMAGLMAGLPGPAGAPPAYDSDSDDEVRAAGANVGVQRGGSVLDALAGMMI